MEQPATSRSLDEILQLKIGEIGRTSRTNVRVNENCFAFDQDSDDFEQLVAKAEAIAGAALKEYEPKTTRADPSVYLKLGVKAAQREWVAISASNWLASLATVHAKYQRRSKPGPLVVELIVFVAKEQSGIRRATASRIEEASREIDLHLSERPDISVGEIARTHWAISHALQPEGTTITAANATLHQAQHIDAMKAALAQPDEEQAEQTLSVSLNGSTPMRLTFNVGELRQLLGLPNYNFLAQGIFSEFQPPVEPQTTSSENSSVTLRKKT
ncbi:hypothetical protein PR002_g1553 [Phytophthora rubi]|uniref:Uncharacterized protein n=1 Tax=Phytophthora rubi TaxID=129364 RepID=A0A6A3P082_9STRA|nr:hypothetical protein PR002_g1553 [Phytophthora rubi]